MARHDYDYMGKFTVLEIKLRAIEGTIAWGICENLIHDITCTLEFWCPEQNEKRKNVRLTSPTSMLIVQEFLTSFGMHLERINPEDDEHIFRIMPNW